MKSQVILDAIEGIDDKYILEANPLKKRFNKAFAISGISTVAACLVLIIGIRYASTPPKQEPISTNLPPITIDIDNFLGGGMGFEGYTANDVSELVNANPWNEGSNISSLPVFLNATLDAESGKAKKPDFELMKKALSKIVENLGIPLSDITIKDNYPDEKTIKDVTEKYASVGQEVPAEFFQASEVLFETEGITANISSNMTTTISLDPPIELPEKYQFGSYPGYDELADLSKYIKKEYSKLISMKKPKTNIYGGDYLTDNNQLFTLSFYDDSGSLEDRIINYNFNSINFHTNDDGKLFIIRLYNPDLSQKVGDYPIISSKEAQELLAQGKYITTVPEDFPGKEYIKKTELIYRSNSYEKMYLPYYRILVELPHMFNQSDNKKTFGAYYVPAIQEKYITNMPIWDGRFN